MDKKYNIIESQKFIQQVEEEKQNVIKKSKGYVGKVLLKGATLVTILSILMSSVAFAGTHNVDNWDDYKNAIVQDLMNQDPDILINYEGIDEFESVDAFTEKVVSLYHEAEEELPTFENQNVMKGRISTNGKVDNSTEPPTYYLSFGQYTVTYKNSAEELEEVDRIIDSIHSEIITAGMSDVEKVRAVYDYVIDLLQYEQLASSDTDWENILKERNLIRALEGQGIVCDAYAMLLSKMLTDLGFENLIVSGKAGGPHAWNLVQVEGQWYSIDATWGDTEIEKEIDEYSEMYPKLPEDTIREIVEGNAEKRRALYFLTSDDVLRDNNHEWDESKFPSAPEVYDFEAVVDESELILQATDAVTLAESEQTQEAVDNARAIVLDIQDEGVQNDLLSRLDAVQEIIDAHNAEIAYQEMLAEISNAISNLENLDDVEGIQTQIDALDEGDDKTTLQNALNTKVEELEAIQTQVQETQATEAVVLAESTGIQADVDNANAFINNLLNETLKAELNVRIEAVQAVIDERVAYEAHIDSISSAIQSLMFGDDVTTIQAEIEALENLADKGTLQTELENKVMSLNVEEEGRLLDNAIEAIELAETSKTQEDVDIALVAVNLLQDGVDKNNLLDRINAIEVIDDSEDVPEDDETPVEEEDDTSEGDSETDQPVDDETPTEDPDTGDDTSEDGEDTSGDDTEGEDPVDEEEPETGDDTSEGDTSGDDETPDETEEDSSTEDETPGEDEPGTDDDSQVDDSDEETPAEEDDETPTEDPDTDDDTSEDGEPVDEEEPGTGDESEQDENEDSTDENETPDDSEVDDTEDDETDVEDAEGGSQDSENEEAPVEEDDDTSEGDSETDQPAEDENPTEDPDNGDEESETDTSDEDSTGDNETTDESETDDIPDETEVDDNQEETPADESDEDDEEDQIVETPDVDDENMDSDGGDDTDNESVEEPANDESTNDENDESSTDDENSNSDTDSSSDDDSNKRDDKDDETEKESTSKPNNTSRDDDDDEGEEETEEPVQVEKSREEIRQESGQKLEEARTIIRVLKDTTGTVQLKGTIKVADKAIEPDVKPYIFNEEQGDIVVPIRFIAEALDYDVQWVSPISQDAPGRVILTHGDKVVLMSIGQDVCFVNGKGYAMDIAPTIEQDRTYVSIEFLLDVLETEFSYEQDGNGIIFDIK